AALRAGASGFLGKSIDPDELVSAIRTVAHGDALLSPSATRRLIERFLGQPEPRDLADLAPDSLRVLTPREREILAMVATGMTNDEIAERLYLSTLTVKTHVNRTMTKLGARDRAQLVVIAYRTGLVTADTRGVT
ncbi:MAG TPA: response regulator transcription factor, partial [Actinopolymorphaceae bacterium]